MKRSIIILMAGVILSISVSAKAQIPGQYQRKQPQPDFFIPDKAISKGEKLPPFKFIPPVSENQETVKKISHKSEKNTAKSPFSASENTPDNFAETPGYKQKYDDYIKDLKVIGETGKIPENKRLDADLAKMNSEERIPVE